MENTKKKDSILTKILLKPEVGILVPILIIVIASMIIQPNVYKNWDGIFCQILSGMAPIGFAALAEMVIIMVGEIDLSIGTNSTLACCFAGYLAQSCGASFWVVIFAAIAMGAFVGFVNGMLSAKLGLLSWITTLATQFLCQGIAATITMGIPQAIRYEDFDYSWFSSGNFVDLDLGFMRLKLSWWFLLILVVTFILFIVVNKTKYGYRLRAVGGNREAALLAGINVSNVKLIAFVLAGVLTVFGGLADTLKNASAKDTNGIGREFRAIISCAIGGISMAGGAGSVWGIFLGIILFHVVQQLLQIAGPSVGLDTNRQLIFMGAILVCAVLLDTVRARVKAKMAVK